MADALLSLRDVDTFYGPVQVHFGVTLTVGRGEIVCLLGGNASGKSTSMKVILGLVRPARRGRSTSTAARSLGCRRRPSCGAASARSRKRGGCFPAMTVRENLLMGAYVRRDATAVAQDCERVLELFPRVRERLGQQAGTLSGGEQQMVAMARALMGRPRLIVMDEPTMGLSPLYVEPGARPHRRDQSGWDDDLHGGTETPAWRCRSRIGPMCCGTGRIVIEGTARDLLGDPRIRDAYLGGEMAA